MFLDFVCYTQESQKIKQYLRMRCVVIIGRQQHTQVRRAFNESVSGNSKMCHPPVYAMCTLLDLSLGYRQ